MLKKLQASKESLQIARDDLQKACDHDKARWLKYVAPSSI